MEVGDKSKCITPTIQNPQQQNPQQEIPQQQNPPQQNPQQNPSQQIPPFPPQNSPFPPQNSPQPPQNPPIPPQNPQQENPEQSFPLTEQENQQSQNSPQQNPQQQNFPAEPQSVVFDSKKMMYYGIDTQGYLTSWILSDINQCYEIVQPIFSYELQQKTFETSCFQNSVIVLDEQNGQLILLCQKKYLIRYDFVSKQASLIQMYDLLQENPHIKIFHTKSYTMLIYGSESTSNIQFFKFNQQTQTFDNIIKVYNGIYRSQENSGQKPLIGYLQIADNSFKINNLNYDTVIIIPLDSEYNSISKFEFYFKIDNKLSPNPDENLGTLAKPYNQNIQFLYITFQVMKYVAGLILDFLYIEINILKNSQDIQWRKSIEFYEQQNQSIILSIKGDPGDNKPQIVWNGAKQKFQFQSLYSVEITHVKILFQSSFGLFFENVVSQIAINDVEMFQIDQNRVVFRIQCDSNLIISNLFIQNQIFDEVYRFHIISTSISVDNLQITNCTVTTPIAFINLLQTYDASLVNYKNIKITNNKCDYSKYGDSLQQLNNSFFFSFSSYSEVANLEVTDNEFCSLSIFTYQQQSQSFSLNVINIKIVQNEFYYQKSVILWEIQSFSPLYNKFYLSDSIFENNTIVSLLRTQKPISFQELFRMSSIIIKDVKFTNQQDIIFINVQDVYDYELSNVIFENTSEYNDKYNLNQTQCILRFQGVGNIFMTNLHIRNRISIERPLVIFQQTVDLPINLKIYNSTFTKLNLTQKSQLYTSSPIFISTFSGSTILFQNLTFDQNELHGDSSTSIQSTTAITIQSVGGETTIQNCRFTDSSSSSKYNYLQITTDKINIIDSYFSNSSIQKNQFLQTGGFIRATTQQLSFINSQMENGTSKFGTFLYIDSYGQKLDIFMKNAKFYQGESQVDGSAFYIDSSNQELQFKCINCQFKDLLTQFIGGNTIKIMSQIPDIHQSQIAINNMIYFEGGSVINIFGQEDSKFLDLSYSYIEMVDIKEITFQDNPISLKQRNLLESQSYQSSTFLTVDKFSQVKIKGIKVFSTSLYQFNYRFLDSKNSFIQMEDSSFIGLNIKNSLISAENSEFNFLNVLFEQLSFQQNQKLIEVQSLIQLNQCLLTTSSTNFKSINCKNCQGSAIRLSQSHASMQDTNFINCNVRILQQNIFKLIIQKIYLKLNKNDLFNFHSIIYNQGMKGGAIYIININKSIDISQSLFENNYAEFGGAIFVSQLDNKKNLYNIIKESQLLNNDRVKFKNNEALYQGGTLFGQYNKNISQNFNLNFKDCKFEQSSAQNIPIIRSNKFKPNFDQKTLINLQNNQNSKWNFIQTNPTKIKITNFEKLKLKYPQLQQYKNTIIFNDFQSGQIIDLIEFALVDEYNNELYNLDNLTVSTQLFFNITSSTNNQTNFEFKPEFFQYSQTKYPARNVKIIGVPGGNLKLSFYLVNQFQDEQFSSFNSSYIFDIIFNFRQCMQGEYKLIYNSFIECADCGNNTYSFDTERCVDCPIGSKCKGKDGILALNGFWRDDINSSNFLSCYNLEENCKGGSFGNNICSEGHTGALCESCDIYGDFWGKSYSKSSQFSCIRCDQISRNAWMVTLSTLYAFISIMLAVRGDYRKSDIHQLKRVVSAIIVQSLPKKKALEFLKRKDEIQKSEQQSSFMVKILTNYFQIVSCISTFNLTIPQSNSYFYCKIYYENQISRKYFKASINVFPQAIGKPIEQASKSIDCALVEIDTDMPVLYLKLIFSEMLPLFYIMMITLWISTKYLICRKKREFNLSFLSSATLFVIFFVLPNLIDQLLALISCRNIGDSIYIVADVSYKCYTKQHIQYIVQLVVPLLLLWLVIIPVGLFLRIRHFRDSLNKNSVKRIYGFLYREYNNKSYYWEFVKIIQKITIIVVLNLYFEDVIVKGFFILIIIFSYGLITFTVKPYKDEWVNIQDTLSTIISFITVLFAMFIYKNPYAYLQIISYIALLTINLFFLIRLLKPIIKYQIIKLSIKIKELLRKIPFIKKYFIEKEQDTNLTAEEKEKQVKRKNIFKKARRSLSAFIQKSLEEKRESLKEIKSKFLVNKQNYQYFSASNKTQNDDHHCQKFTLLLQTQLNETNGSIQLEKTENKNKKFNFGETSIINKLYSNESKKYTFGERSLIDKYYNQDNLTSLRDNDVQVTEEKIMLSSGDQAQKNNKYSQSSLQSVFQTNLREQNEYRRSTLVFTEQCNLIPSIKPSRVFQANGESQVEILDEIEKRDQINNQ